MIHALFDKILKLERNNNILDIGIDILRRADGFFGKLLMRLCMFINRFG